MPMPPTEQTVAASLLAALPPNLGALLGRVCAVAERAEMRLWLVGGAVRDLLLRLPLGRDLDLAVEGDATMLAIELAHKLGGRVMASHQAFGTATLALPQPSQAPLLVDLARTRAERYPRPAALPEVVPASISEDLLRRDFSVNALALELRSHAGRLDAGRLLDPFGGQADLRAGVLRLLHNASLRDDPTRLLRGLRLATRLHLQPAPGTAALIAEANAAGYLALLSPERVLGELCLALQEPRPDEVLRLADLWEVSPQIVPGLRWSEPLAARAARLAASNEARPFLWAGLLLYELDEPALGALRGRYPLLNEVATLLVQLAALRQLAPRLGSELPNSAIERLLRPFGTLAVAVLHYADPSVANITAHYLSSLRTTRALLDGNDLRRLGVPAGPRMGQLLEGLRAATLDGLVSSGAAAEAWVLQQLRHDA